MKGGATSYSHLDSDGDASDTSVATAPYESEPRSPYYTDCPCTENGLGGRTEYGCEWTCAHCTVRFANDGDMTYHFVYSPDAAALARMVCGYYGENEMDMHVWGALDPLTRPQEVVSEVYPQCAMEEECMEEGEAYVYDSDCSCSTDATQGYDLDEPCRPGACTSKYRRR